MNDKLTCDIVRDLLPSYADGLTSKATNEALDSHLAGCEDCSEALRRMKEPEKTKAEPLAEVDYLKKVRRRTKRRSLLIGIALMLLAISLLSFRLFYVGAAASAADAAYNVEVDGDTVRVSGTLTSSGLGVSRATFSDSNGIVRFKIYTSPKAFFNSGDFSETYTAASAVGQVRADDLIIWENGTEISRTAAQLFAAVNPYVGDMPSNGRIAEILGVRNTFGAYENTLHTAEEPYGWMLTLETDISSDEESAARDIMTADSYAMLASIGNLGYVTWEYKTESGAREYTVTAQDASSFAGRDIKLCASSVSELQKLIQSLSFKWSGVREALQEDGLFLLCVRNYSDAEIYGFSLNYYLGGELVGSGAVVNADGTSLKKGGDFSFDFAPEDFPAGTSAIALSDFSFDLSVILSDGSEAVVCRDMKLSAKYAWTYYYSLTGDFSAGLTLTEG